MARSPEDVDLSHRVENQLVRTSEYFSRMDRTPAARAAYKRNFARGTAAWSQRAANIGLVLGILAVATIVFGMITPIGLVGLFVVMSIAVLAILVLGLSGGEKPIVEYKEDMPNRAVVQRLDSLLVRKRAALPAPATRQLDAISQQLPLLESRLAEAPILDPLAQDARRLMGKHLPELIERYERVPAEYRAERDGEGLTVDERFVQGLDAAKTALDDLGRKLAREDLDAFATQGRFIESRYKDEDGAIRAE
jgi:hypothetical protein